MEGPDDATAAAPEARESSVTVTSSSSNVGFEVTFLWLFLPLRKRESIASSTLPSFSYKACFACAFE
jgi:hypothetical protein